jgi:hypothetical protein
MQEPNVCAIVNVHRASKIRFCVPMYTEIRPLG